MSIFRAIFIASLVFLSFQDLSFAHTKSVSYSTWTIQEDQAILDFTVSSREVTKLKEYQLNYPDLEKSITNHLVKNITSEQILPSPSVNILNTEIGTTGISLKFDINQADDFIIDMNVFFDQIPGHIHYAKINQIDYKKTMALNQNSHEIVILNNESETIKPVPFDSFKQHVGLGFAHILEGIDHLLFLLALLILCNSLKSLIFAATGFTIGHSLTLALAASNVVIPQVNIIESLIGWTIVLASIESLNLPNNELKKIQWVISAIAIMSFIFIVFNMIDLSGGFIFGLGLLSLAILKLNEDVEQANKLRPMLAIIFGTIHGFGFANILNEISLDRANFLVSLVGFNIGVEIGQILVLLIMWFIVSFFMRRILAEHMQKITEIVSSFLCSIGLYWFLMRLFG